MDSNREVGGTWYENTYPGCRVDVANHFYSDSFAQKEDHRARLPELRLLLAGRHRTLDVRPEVHDAYNARIDAGNARMAWGAPSAAKVSSWYKNPSGRVPQNWPFTLLEYWRQTKEPRASDYTFG